MSDKGESVRGVKVAVRKKVAVEGIEIEVVADGKAVQTFGEHDQLEAKARSFIQTQQLLGLDVKAVKRIIFSTTKPIDSQDLFQPNGQLWNRLTGFTEHMENVKLWMCSESEACQCCYCVEIKTH